MRSRRQVAPLWEEYQAASEHDRGAVTLMMWANALVATALNGTLAVVVVLAARRSWRSRESGVVSALRAGPSRTLVWVIGAMLVHDQGKRLWLLPALHRRVGGHQNAGAAGDEIGHDR